MRVLLLLRGAPGCGKSTLIKNYGLQNYCLSSDDIRQQFGNIGIDAKGNSFVSFKDDTLVWQTVFSMLENRMKHGDFTVIDATNSKTSDMNEYRDLAESYRYRTFIIDMTDTPIEVCKEQNKQRLPYKIVPDEAIDKMYARFRNQGIPGRIKKITKNQIYDILTYKPANFSKFKKIVHIGDIHGCYTALMEYFKDGLSDDTIYIFTGDYVDRGIENDKTMEFLLSIYNKPNVKFIEGNHERWLYNYANDAPSRSKEFEFKTKPQLDAANIDKKEIREFYRHLGQCVYYTYGDKKVFICHGGIPRIPNLMVADIASEDLIKGVGEYKDSQIIAETWLKSTDENTYQIHGHRNIFGDPIQVNERVFNLEGQIEFGGHLRIVELTEDGFKTIEIKNTVFRERAEEVIDTKVQIESQIDSIQIGSIDELLVNMRNNKFIAEKKYGNISSFNFTSKAFYDKIWNEQTEKARGLYINTVEHTIVARGFDKFFKVNERSETKIDVLPYKLKFPVTAYVKENGYLGLVSYNSETDDLFITTKSSPDGDYAVWLSNQIHELISVDGIKFMKDYCKVNNVTLLFESINIEHDPHIIEYPKSTLYLLAIVKNEINFFQLPYDEIINVAQHLNINHKIKDREFNNWADLYKWYLKVTSPDYTKDINPVEGFVLEDSNGYMVKVKTEYYNFWKFMRGIVGPVLKQGYIRDTGALYNDISNDFYGFLRNIYNTTSKEDIEVMNKDIISLRKKFLEANPEYNKE